MTIRSFISLFVCIAFTYSCIHEVNNQDNKIELTKEDSLKVTQFKQKAYSQNLFSQEYQEYLDSALQINPNDAYLWQQKAMPCFKSKKYEVGMKYLDKAVEIDSEGYLEYRAFIKCIFSKQYADAIVDFNKVKKLYGNSYVMDHSYDFFIGLSYLQLNNFEKANLLFDESIQREIKKHGEDWVHHLDWFYLGISEFELGNNNKAIFAFDKALKIYQDFSDAQYYKVICLARLGRMEEANKLLLIGEKNSLQGKTINDANSKYETYPYQVVPEQFERIIY